MVVINHGQERDGRVNRQKCPQSADSYPFRDFQEKFRLPEARQVGVIARKARKQTDIQSHRRLAFDARGEGFAPSPLRNGDYQLKTSSNSSSFIMKVRLWGAIGSL